MAQIAPMEIGELLFQQDPPWTLVSTYVEDLLPSLNIITRLIASSQISSVLDPFFFFCFCFVFYTNLRLNSLDTPIPSFSFPIFSKNWLSFGMTNSVNLCVNDLNKHIPS